MEPFTLPMSAMNCRRLRASHSRSTSCVASAPWTMRTPRGFVGVQRMGPDDREVRAEPGLFEGLSRATTSVGVRLAFSALFMRSASLIASRRDFSRVSVSRLPEVKLA